MNRSGMAKYFVAALAFSVGASASALDFKLSGDFNNRFGLYTDQALVYRASETIGTVAAPGAVVSSAPIGESWAEIKYRLAGNVASDDQKIRGVVGFEWGSIRFGDNPSIACTAAVAGAPGATATCTNAGSVAKNSGGNFSGDGVNTELRFAYTDVVLPTAFKSNLTVGLQPFVVNKYLWQETATGVQVVADPGPVGLKLAWMRGIEIFNSRSGDAQFGDADNILARVDLGKQVPGLKAGAFYLFQHRLPKGAAPAAISHLLKNFGAVDYNIHNIGIDGSFTAGPLFANLDAIYQTGSIRNTTGTSTATLGARSTFDLRSFFAHLDVGANLGPARVMYTGWYASGDTNRNDSTIHNYIATDLDMNDSIIFQEGGLTDDNYFTEAPYFLDKGAIFNKLAIDYKATPKLTVGVAGLYVMMAEEAPIGAGNKSRILGTEFDAYVSYLLYEGLTVAFNAGYLIAGDGMDYFELVKDGKSNHNIFRATAGLRYRFGAGPI